MKKITLLLILFFMSGSVYAYRPFGHIPPRFIEPGALSILLYGVAPQVMGFATPSCEFEVAISTKMPEEQTDPAAFGEEFKGLMERYHYWRAQKKSGVDLWKTKVTDKCVTVTYCIFEVATKDFLEIDAATCPAKK